MMGSDNLACINGFFKSIYYKKARRCRSVKDKFIYIYISRVNQCAVQLLA